MGIYYGKADFITYGKPSLFLDFANKKSLTDRISGNNLITFTRTSSATYVGSDGSIKTASANEARFDHNPVTGESLGLLIEEARTNLFVNNHTYAYRFINNPVSGGWVNALGSSSDNTQFTGSNATVTTDLPGGVIGTAARATLNGSDVNASFQFDGISFSAGILSTYIRSNKSCSIGWGTEIDFQTYSLQANVWTRVSASLSSNPWANAVRNLRANSRISNISGGYPVTFDLCFVQQEAGSFPTSYIPTAGSQVTRNADSASITGSNFSSWYNSSEGTAYIDVIPKGISNGLPYQTYFSFNSSSGDRWGIAHQNGTSGAYPSNSVIPYVGTGGAFSNTLDGTFLAGQKISIGMHQPNGTNIQSSRDGGSIQTVSTSRNPLITNLLLGGQISDNSGLMGTLKRFTYYPTRLTNAQLQNLTR